jgi:hypothetical protein
LASDDLLKAYHIEPVENEEGRANEETPPDISTAKENRS